MAVRFLPLLFVTTSLFLLRCDNNMDPCDGVTCNAPQSCVNGDCVCPQGYTGNACDQEVAPSRVTIKSITINQFPAEDVNGQPWDDMGNPDIRLGIFDGAGVNELFLSSLKEEADPSGTHTFTVNLDIEGTQLFDQLGLALREYDETSSEFILGNSFPVYESGQGFPEVYTLMGAGLQGEVSLEYSF